MDNEALMPLGPLFGPNFITVQVNDETGRLYQLQVYPDANNARLKGASMPRQYYFVPQRVYLAKKQTAPADFDFGMTIFKGLMTTETTLGITDANTTGGTAEIGGSICTFSTTFAIPDSVIQNALQKLKAREFDTRPAVVPFLAALFHIDSNEPDPNLGIVTIVENDVTIEIPDLVPVGTAKIPFFLSAQGAGKGSVEASGISSFLVTCNTMAAGAIAGALKNGKSPFTVHYNLKQQFYVNECQITVKVDVDKMYDQFSAAVSAGGFLGINNASLSFAYEKCVTTGGIKTIITMNNAVLGEDDELKKMIDKQVDEMREQAFNLVKTEIFDWHPTGDTPASTERGLFSRLFGGSAVSLKGNFQRRGVHFENNFVLNGTIPIIDRKSGTLNDLEPAVRADLNKYLAVVEIDEYFKKLQVAAQNNINWGEKLPDGTQIGDPVESAQIEVAYPEFSQPTNAAGQALPQFRAQGFHYTVGTKNPDRPSELAVWTRDTPRDIINIAFLKLDRSLPDWDQNQVRIRKTIVFDSSDPRVELANGGSVFSVEQTIHNHAPIVTPDEVGYTFVRFVLDRPLPNDALSATLTCKFGGRTDTFNITKANQKNVIWEVFSDKYVGETEFSYDLLVSVVGPNFTDEPINWGTPEPIKVPLPTGRLKYINPFKLSIPPIPAEKRDQINDYIKSFQTA
ncbi:hypothetical protein [Microvirga massiliensis]|uniref:hypothetical protein n=1 Tax=Microvirga massiliensis TaxID=1033741 RepID=UPI00062BC3FC|nr:hypothetical protein [Microvirga massiliensis]